MPRTMILQPLSMSELEEGISVALKKDLEKIHTLLDSLKPDDNMTFTEFLEKLGLSEKCYLEAIRLSLKHDTLLLKRSPTEIRINFYNPNLLKAWKANMDVQYILDPYACLRCLYSFIYYKRSKRNEQVTT